MSNGTITNPGVEIVIEGVFPLLFRLENNQIVECLIGAIKNVPEHFFSIVIKKNGAIVNPGTILPNLRIQVENTSQTNISLKLPNEPIDRLTGEGDPQSFRWVLDFEGNEVFTNPIGINQGNLEPILRIDRGELSTASISQNHLLKRLPGPPLPQWTLIGKVATQVRAQIALDLPNSTAQLINGDFPVGGTLTSHGEQLEIQINNRRPPHPGHSHPDDANNYYLAIGPTLPPSQKLIFKSTPLVPVGVLPATPEASCLIGRMGSTPGDGS
jgi:hypothetical protein